MDKACFLAMTITITLALIIVLIVVLKDRDFDFSIRKDKKNDALHINAKHHDNLDKWFWELRLLFYILICGTRIFNDWWEMSLAHFSFYISYLLCFLLSITFILHLYYKYVTNVIISLIIIPYFYWKINIFCIFSVFCCNSNSFLFISCTN